MVSILYRDTLSVSGINLLNLLNLVQRTDCPARVSRAFVVRIVALESFYRVARARTWHGRAHRRRAAGIREVQLCHGRTFILNLVF